MKAGVIIRLVRDRTVDPAGPAQVDEPYQHFRPTIPLDYTAPVSPVVAQYPTATSVISAAVATSIGEAMTAVEG